MKKITSLNLGSLIGLIVALALGFGIGAIVGDVPHVNFKKEIDIGALISLASLLGAIYIIPYVIEKSFATRRHKSNSMLSEIDSAISKLSEFMQNFRKKYFDESILSQQDIQIITLDARSITNLLDSLTNHALNHSGLESMRTDIFDEFNLRTVADYTDTIRIGEPINQATVLKASNSTENIIAKLRNYRYQLKSE